jgi:hypothetical protein
MRLQDLTEAKLGADQIPANKASAVKNPRTGKPFTRPELFLYKVINSSPFTKVSGEEVIIDPKEARKVSTWVKSGPVGVISMLDTDGNPVKNTDLQKTVEFGSKESEGIPVKPADVFPSQDIDPEKLDAGVASILDYGGFPASELYNKIANSHLKDMGQVGDAVIAMAKQISQGQVPTVPDNLSAQEQKAIELYASEFLGVMSVLNGVADFPKRDAFLNWVGQDLGSLLLYFPKNTSNPIADSYGLLNRQTGNALAMSSKAAGKGAPPALTSLKVPDFLKKKYPEAYSFIKKAQETGLSGVTQPFALMNWLYQYQPELVPEVWRPFLPWQPDEVQDIVTSFKHKGGELPPQLMTAAKARLSPQVAKGKATDGGKVFYAVINDVMKLVNAGAVPNFREAVLTSLGFNFVQIYSNIKNGKLITRAFWPAKVDGKVSLKTKSSAQEDKGKISYQVSD